MSCISYRVEKHVAICFLENLKHIETLVEVRLSSARGCLSCKPPGLPKAACVADVPRSLAPVILLSDHPYFRLFTGDREG